MSVMWIALFGLLTGDVYAGYCTQSYEATCSRLERYYTSCGLLWWGSCTRHWTVYYSCIRYRQGCCSGYTGSSCNTPLCDGSQTCPNGGTCQSPNMCSCPNGYSSPGCNDINECVSSTHGCNQTCVNTNGSYHCTCGSGYTLSSDLKSCIDLDECSLGTSGCEHQCRNTVGSYVCSCKTGYTLAVDRRQCEDLNECNKNSGGCSQTCNNNVGSYTCSCRSGYRLSGRTCYDLDECSLGTSGCEHQCRNTVGSYVCSCKTGYTLAVDRRQCEDIDECAEDTALCKVYCNNNQGSYTCYCSSGFILEDNGYSCKDLNECAIRNGNCDQKCINEPGSHRCECYSGYRIAEGNSGNVCKDIDECNESSARCTHICNNTDGSYTCSCNLGYYLNTDGYTCMDTNDCEGVTCENGGYCADSLNSYTCICKAGFSGQHCGTDIDECSGTSHGCQHDCRNTAGSYDCICRAGYVRSYDLKTCIVDCGHPGDISNGIVSVSSTLSGGSATYTCNSDYSMTSGDRVRYCQNDFTWSGTEPTCIFSNHCNSSPCRNGATCVNFVGGFRCTCSQWWSGQICETDIQPPVLTGCSEDVHINATGHTVQYSWTEPTFTDPRGSDLNIVSNYPSSEFTFPWGDYTVQYVATKTSNGLQTECSFQIKVRPTPCEELNVPVNGARLCNGWKTDYGRFCMIMCQQNYTIGPSQSYYTWHVCGASGNWIAASPVPDCEVPVTYEYEDEYYHPEYAGYVYSSSCEDDATRNTLQTLYIDYLKGTDGFSSFCSTYESECIKENVEVKC